MTRCIPAMPRLGRDGDRTMASLYDLIKAKQTEKRFIHPVWGNGIPAG